MKNEKINYALLGGLIYYYRNNLRLTRDAFARKLSDISNTKVTSKTIQRIENGEYSRIKDIYKNIYKVLSFNYAKENEDIYDQISSLSNNIYSTLNNTSLLNNAYELLQETHDLYNSYRNFFYIDTILRLLDYVLSYYLYGSLEDKKEIDVIYANYSLFDDKQKILCSYLFFVYAKHNKRINDRDLLTFGKNMVNKKIFLFEELHYYTRINNKYDLLPLYKNKFSKTNDPVEKFAYLSNMAYIELNYYGLDDAIKHLEEALSINNIKNIIPERNYCLTYVRLGIINYQKKNYQKCFDYLYSIATDYPRVLNFNFILLCISAEKTNQTDKVLPILKAHQNTNILINDIIDYFIAKYENEDPVILEDMIITKLNPNTLSSGIYIDIFKNELFETVKKTKHYAKLLLINKKDD